MTAAEAKIAKHTGSGAAKAAADGPRQAELLERARVLAERALARAEETERSRMVPPDLVEEMKASGLMRVRQPKQWGGLERSALEFYELVHAVSQGCGSAGWVFCVLTGHAHSIADFPAKAQEDVWGKDPGALASSSFAPVGMAKPADAGFRLNGRFPFSSGCDHAQWCIVGAFLEKDGGARIPHLFLVPKSSLTVVDDWFTMGLAGTGSKSLTATDVFVPAHRAIPMPLFGGSIAPFSLQASMIGAALGGLKRFVADTKGKPGKMGAPPPAQSDHFQTLVGESWGDLSAAWLVLAGAVQRTENITSNGGGLSEEHICANRAANALISRLSVNAIERVFELSGGQGVYNGSLSRAFRDVRAGAQHGTTNSSVTARAAGAYLLATT